MGAGPDFAGEPQFEVPAHQVAISRPFRLSAHEVTAGQWAQVMGRDDVSTRRKAHPLTPAVNVSWEDVQIFLGRLSRIDERPYRLPTEAEWEYAARAGTTTAWYFGSDPEKLPEHAWCGADVQKGEIQKVGQKPPNPWGLHDVYGNAAEWVSDWFGEGYYTERAATDPKGPAAGAMRVVRGGAYASDAAACQSAWRDSDLPMVRSNFIGFRVAYDE